MSRIASNVDSVVKNIEKSIEENANVYNMTKIIDIKSTKDARQKRYRIYSKCDALANRVVISFFYDRHKIRAHNPTLRQKLSVFPFFNFYKIYTKLIRKD